jgi:tRNA (adenine-N(1)-)-methyltransferase non-catalytic subunit
LNAETLAEDATPSESRGDPGTPGVNGAGEMGDALVEYSSAVTKNNRLTVDDTNRQALSQEEIEELKKSAGGKEIIEKILANHAGLDEKTAFSRAKYTLRKTKKYLKRFTALPMDLRNLMEYISDKEAPRIMELREETLGLMLAWSHVHYSGDQELGVSRDGTKIGGGRWLVADDTGGLVVASMAEKMGFLFPDACDEDEFSRTVNGEQKCPDKPMLDDVGVANELDGPTTKADEPHIGFQPPDSEAKSMSHNDFLIPASTNTITIVHPAVQPNLSALKYFGYDTNQPNTSHPLHTHLKPLSWLQLLHPEDDATYREPEQASESELKNWKSGKRGTYWKKRRRWERCKSIVDETRAGGFDGLVIASNMDPATMLPHLVPLVRGGGHIVLYSPTSEPLVKVMDLYSKDRRTAYINLRARGETRDPEDFPVDLRLLLAPTLQTSRVREWQVLPGRTHPMMSSKGGPEGYVLTARRVVPLEGGVEARGNFAGRKRKADGVVEK